MTDTRVVYGATCSWWDSIDKVGRTPTGLPGCPHCGGVLFEIGNEAEWWVGARRHEAEAEPGYVAFLEWLRGRCFPGRDGLGRARVAYAEEQRAAELVSKVLLVRVPVEIDERLAREEPGSAIEARILRGIAHVLPSWIRLDVELDSLDARLAVTIED